MERKFYLENFEKFLKGHADQFKMTPSKKVWHGIYNDLHPGRRWPSVAITMVFIFTLIIIGHLNTNNGHYTALNDLNSSHNLAVVKSTHSLAKRSSIKQEVNQNNPDANISNDDPANTASYLLPVITDDQAVSNPKVGLSNVNGSESNKTVFENKSENISTEKIENTLTLTSNVDNITTASQDLTQAPASEEESAGVTSINNKEVSTFVKDINSNIPVQANENNIQKRKRNSSVIWTYSISPSFSYRYFSDEKMNKSVTQKPMIGYEAGTAMSFNIFKKLQFTTGLQLNYSGYKIKANSTHPIVATIILNSETPGQYSAYSTMSHYGNTTSTELSTLKNYSLQASIPIGLQYVFAANDNIKIGAAAAIQPTLIIANQAYLLSTDKKNYLTAPNLYRNWNMNTNFTTYISFSSNSFNWQIGPQIRYQLLSTYSNHFPVKEHLINYGIRLGISKISK